MALFSGIKAGIKRNSVEDFGLILPEVESPKVIGFFTSNKIRSEVIDRAERILSRKKTAKAIAVISGNAMCRYIGVERDAEKICKALVDELNSGAERKRKISTEDIILLATGKIGEKLNVEPVISAIPELVRNLSKDPTKFSYAIMTTDRKPKLSEYKNGPIHIIGIAKGAGMIFPHFSSATTLSFIIANARFENEKAIFRILEKTIGAVNIDSCMSTNDSSIFVFDGNDKVSRSSEHEFIKGLSFVLSDLAVKIAEDGEGVGRIVKVLVSGAQNYRSAKVVSEAVSSSMLFKSSVGGGAPDFGRILSAVGAAGVNIREVNVYISDEFEIMGYNFSITQQQRRKVQVVKNTKIITDNLNRAREIMNLPRYTIFIDVGFGKQVSAYTIMTDLTEEYVKINKSL